VPDIDVNGTVHASPFVLPESALLSPETRSELDRARRADGGLTPACGSDKGATADRILAIRRCEIDEWRRSPERKALFDSYSVKVHGEEIAGVYADVFIPTGGVAAENRQRILINVHGGGFLGCRKSVPGTAQALQPQEHWDFWLLSRRIADGTISGAVSESASATAGRGGFVV